MKNMKRMLSTIFVLLLLVFTVTGCGKSSSETSTKASSEEPVTIRLAYNLPASHHVSKGVEKFAQTVGEKSEGRINIEIYPAGQLYSDKEMNEAILAGNLEMGVNSNSMWSTVEPAMGIFDVPFLFPNYQAVGNALDGELGELLSQAMEEKGVKVLMWGDYGFSQFASNGKPLKSPDDFKGLKIRAYGDIIADTIKSFGGSPVFTGGGEVYMALQRGTVDGASSGATAMVSRKYYEVVDYLTVNNAFFVEFPLVVSLDFWNTLSEEDQKLIADTASEVEKEIRAEAEQTDLNDIETLKEEGMEVYVVPENELATWRQAAQPTWEMFKKNSGELGTKALEIIEQSNQK